MKKMTLGKQKNKSGASSVKDDVKREGWSAKKLGEESSYDDTTENKRRLLRGNEETENAEEQDLAGSVDFLETPAGKEEMKVLRRTKIKTKTRKQV